VPPGCGTVQNSSFEVEPSSAYFMPVDAKPSGLDVCAKLARARVCEAL
jgi:hypothetical protein